MNIFKSKKKPTSSLLTEKLSDTFDFSSQLTETQKYDKNFKSIFNYQSMDLECEDPEKEKENKFIIIIFGVLLVVFFPILGWFSLKIITKNRKLAVYRCGKLMDIKSPGVAVTIPFIDSCHFIDTDVKDCNIKHASCTTSDQGLVELDCVVKYRVIDPKYLIQSVSDWQEHVTNEIRLCLLECVKYFRWSDFKNDRVLFDIQVEMKKSFSTKDSTKGLEIKDIVINNMSQGPEPETPMDLLKKINFKDLGRHLSTMTPMLINPSIPKEAIPPNPLLANDETDLDPSESSHNKAIDEFFEKLEIIKNLALNSKANATSTGPGTSSSSFPFFVTPNGNTETTIPTEQLIDLDYSEANNKTNTGGNRNIEQLLGDLVKYFIRTNMNWSNAQQILRDGNLDSIFNKSSSDHPNKYDEKLKEISLQLTQLTQHFGITGNIQFVISRYFTQPCYFYFNSNTGELSSGKGEEFKMSVSLD